MYPTHPPYPGSNQGNLPPTGPPQVGFYPQQPGYPPSGFGQQTPYPASPYPPAGGFAPGSAPYPGAPVSAPYPGAPSISPYPGAPVSSPYPGAPGSSPYPGAPGSSPYPGAPISSPYPGAPGYPPVSPYPGAPAYPGASPYPPSVSPTPTGGLYSSQPPAQFHTSSVNYGSSSAPVKGSSAPSALLHGSHANAGPMATVQAVPEIPTIREAYFDPSQDAQALRTAMKGFGTDEKALINVLCKRTNAQRMQILNTYKASFGKDLVKDLKSETGGNFEDLLVALMTPRFDFMAERVKSAVSGIGTKEHVLIDILCTSSNQELQWIQHAFQRLYSKRLEEEVASDTSGHFQRLLISMCAAGRNEDPRIDPGMVQQDAQALQNAGLKQWGTDESVFNMIMATRSYPHLREVFFRYEQLTGQDIERTIKGEFSGDIEDAMLAIVQCVKNRPAYFAKRLNDAMRGIGTKDNALIFYLVTRCEIDLETIKNEYLKMYNKSLAQDISSETSGDYKKGLLTLLGQ